MSHTRISVAIITSTTKVSAGYCGLGLKGLLLSHFLGFFTSTTMYVVKSRQAFSRIFEKVTLASLRSTAYEYRTFPLYSLPQTLLNAVSQNLPFLLIASYYSAAETGQYYFAFGLLGLPITLSSQVLRNVAYQKTAELVKTNGNIHAFILKSTLLLLFLGIIPAMLVFLFGPFLFSFFLGAQWEQAGVFASILIMWFFTGFLNIPAMVYFQAQMKQKFLLNYEIVSSIVRIILLVIGGRYLNIYLFLLVYSVAGVLLNSFIIIRAITNAKRDTI